jgi:hypothetical protein
MATFNVFSPAGQSTDNFWPDLGGGNAAPVINNSSGNYTILTIV